jgi:hypothetical protein
LVSGKIIGSIKAAPIFSIILDTAQNISEVDQLRQICPFQTAVVSDLVMIIVGAECAVMWREVYKLTSRAV